MLLDTLSLLLAISSCNEIATRQLLRQFDAWYPDNYPKIMLLKIIPLLTPSTKAWLQSLYQ
jgi:hypothetical protein